MRLQSIKVDSLFGIFNHKIPMNLDDRITIIHGPNGFGKTAVLRLISDIFESRHTAVRELPFKRVELRFDDGQILEVKKVGPARTAADQAIIYHCPPHEPFELSKTELSESLVSTIDNYIGGLHRTGPQEWLHEPLGEILDLDEVLDRFGRHLPFDVRGDRYPDWLIQLRDSLDVNFVRATRLEPARAPGYPGRKRRRKYTASVVSRYADELADHIRGTLASYAELSQSLDRSFPRRLVNESAGSVLAMDQIELRLGKLEERRKELTGAGLLDKEQESHFDASNIDESKAEALSLYIQDVEEKLAKFDELYDRIDLLKSILNNRFQFKTVAIDKSDGIEFRTDDGALLEPNFLSSGEQHEVVMLYQLLFKVKKNSLMLIDEPELSLHIAWQEQFLTDLKKITDVSSFDVLIATHSPQIIGERWDLTVALEEPSKLSTVSP